jgi:hypothetical protein
MDVKAAFAPLSASTDAVAPGESNRPDANLRAQILKRIQEQTRPAPLPKPWDFLGSSRSTRQLLGEPVDLVAALQTEFSVEQLFIARMIKGASENQPRLAPVFGDSSSSFVIRRDASRSPVDAISARGLLSSPVPDWLPLLAERTDAVSGHPRPVLLAFSDAEVLVLRRLDGNFTSAAGLEQLSGNHARELFAGRAEQRWQRRYNLTLPGWQLAECLYKPAPKTVAALEHLLRLQPLFKRDVSELFDVWMPTREEFRTIRSALTSRDRDYVQQAFFGSLAKSRFTPASALCVIRDRAPIDYGTARRNLVCSIDRSAVVPLCAEVGRDLAKLRRAFKQGILDKLVDSVAAESSPWKRLRNFVGADLGNAWFETLDEVAAAQKIVAGEYPDCRDADERLEKRLRIGDRIAKHYALALPR